MKNSRPTGAQRLFAHVNDAEFANELSAPPETEEEKADDIPDEDDAETDEERFR